MRRPLATVAAATLLASMVLLLPGSGAVRPAHGLSYSSSTRSSAGSSRGSPPAS
jgi:hypothetical protein